MQQDSRGTNRPNQLYTPKALHGSSRNHYRQEVHRNDRTLPVLPGFSFSRLGVGSWTANSRRRLSRRLVAFYDRTCHCFPHKTLTVTWMCFVAENDAIHLLQN